MELCYFFKEKGRAAIIYEEVIVFAIRMNLSKNSSLRGARGKRIRPGVASGSILGIEKAAASIHYPTELLLTSLDEACFRVTLVG